MNNKDARGVALDALTAFRKRNARIEGYLKNEMGKNNLSRQDSALATEITNGVLQNMLYLDYCISCFSSIKINKISPGILDIMRASAYQILFLDRVPDSATVNDAVARAKRNNYKAGGFVNAVLRKLSAQKKDIPKPEGDSSYVMSVSYSTPLSLVNALVREYGEKVCEDILRSNNEKVPTTIRVNTLKTTSEALIKSLSDKGLNAEKDIAEDSVRIASIGNIEKSDEFGNGLFYVQDTASQLAAKTLSPKSGASVLDACAAPGGKSFYMAMQMKNIGKIVSCDVFEHKLKLIDEGAKRLGINIITTEIRDASEYDAEYDQNFDFILADVPCSGFGIIRRKPDIRYKNADETGELPSIQLKILENLSEYVKKGGCILYSTCTILSRENSDVIRSFVSKRNDFEEMSGDYPDIPHINNEYGVTFLPHLSGTDGFYMCKLRRKND